MFNPRSSHWYSLTNLQYVRRNWRNPNLPPGSPPAHSFSLLVFVLPFLLFALASPLHPPHADLFFVPISSRAHKYSTDQVQCSAQFLSRENTTEIRYYLGGRRPCCWGSMARFGAAAAATLPKETCSRRGRRLHGEESTIWRQQLRKMRCQSNMRDRKRKTRSYSTA